MEQKNTWKFNTVEDYDLEIARQRELAEKFEKERQRAYSEKEKNLKEMNERLAAMAKPFDENMDRISDAYSAAKTLANELDWEKRKFEFNLEILRAEKAGQHDEDSFNAWLNLRHMESRGLSSHGAKVSIKKDLSNGIRVFRWFDEYSGTRMFFFKGTEFIGYWRKRKAEHPGDETKGFGWIGQSILNKENTLEELENKKLHLDLHVGMDWKWKEEKHPFFRDGARSYNTKTDPTVVLMLKYAEEFKGNLPEINFKDEKTHDTIKGWY